MSGLIFLSAGIAAVIGGIFCIGVIIMSKAARKSMPSSVSGGGALDAGSKDGLPAIDESIENVSASTNHFLQKHPSYIVIPLVVVIVLEAIFILASARDPRVYVAPLILPLIGYSIARNRIQHEFMKQFASANGFSYTPGGSLDGLDGSLFQIGNSRSVADVVSGQFQNRPISLFTYTYVTGSGKSEQTHTYTIYELQFDVTLPDILLENASHAFGGSLFEKLSGKEFIKLEGDFNKYFSLCIPRGYETEALEIFTPDVMEELIEKAKAFSLEIVNGHLFIYNNGTVGTKQGLYDLYALAQYFIEKLGPVLARMKPSVEAMEQFK